MLAGASLFLDFKDLLLPGDEKFDREEKDESISQCSILVGPDALNEDLGMWQKNLDELLLHGTMFPTLSLYVAEEIFAAWYWYDGQYVQNAKEDAAQLALQSLKLPQTSARQDSTARLRPVRKETQVDDSPRKRQFINCATIKIVKAYPPSGRKDLVKCGFENVSLDEIRRTLESDIRMGSIPDEDLHPAW
ncbi:hypothetical protein PISL3812_03711 [Talaromyces islandicus]|uniref:Uncharacterized protein n=1 Tax=Talaromyces islandicus TaxID=28573 RepID=A0A0U1LVK8_TALIS|nr:hypothetical protein PISL3812_03711 [Talaromyces islandicus]